ncbi:MAG: 23S rRNA (uracil(1939)-C(5))-methyltransferase RlmD [Armatimonadota bacterium]
MKIDDTGQEYPHVGEQLTVTIEALASGGDGIARPGGFTLFVPQSVPGDELKVEVTKVTSHFGRARIVQIITPGPDRVPSPCPLSDECPGCQFQHLRYEAQLAAKRTFVIDGLERIGRLTGVEVLPTLGMTVPWHYRNKGEFIAERIDGHIRLGYHREGGAGILPVSTCPIQHPLSMQILAATEEVATEEDLPLAQLITRVSPNQHRALAILVCWEWHDRLPAAAAALQERVPELAGVLWSRVRGRSVVRRTLAASLVGDTRLVQQLGKWEYTVSAESFFQVNNEQAARLVHLADEYAGNLSNCIYADGYCGAGTFLIPLAGRSSSALGIEEHPVALRDAETNLARYAIHNTRLFEGRMEVVLSRMLRKGRNIDVMVLDPPRKGVGRVVLEQMAGLGVRRAVLVSCDPSTFGRDVGDLAALGYELRMVQPVDMFPQTWHVETIALAVRK